MRTCVQKTVQLGDLVLAVFDAAGQYSSDPQEVSCLATQAVAHLLRRTQRTSISPLRPTPCTKAADLSLWI